MAIIINSNNTSAIVNQIKGAISEALERSGQLVENEAARECPVDTGRLQNSITHEVEGHKKVVIGTNVEYAGYVENGTSKMRARPYLRKALTNKQSKIADIFKEELEK